MRSPAAVIGAGLMGAAIAKHLAAGGLKVMLLDVRYRQDCHQVCRHQWIHPESPAPGRLTRICIEALGYQRSSPEMLEQQSDSEISRCMTAYLESASAG